MVTPTQRQETKSPDSLKQITYENYTEARPSGSSLYVLIYFTLQHGSLTLDWDSLVCGNAEA